MLFWFDIHLPETLDLAQLIPYFLLLYRFYELCTTVGNIHTFSSYQRKLPLLEFVTRERRFLLSANRRQPIKLSIGANPRQIVPSLEGKRFGVECLLFCDISL